MTQTMRPTDKCTALPEDGTFGRLVQINQTDSREREDRVGPYRKSPLYLVARAFKDGKADVTTPTHGQPMLGMQALSDKLRRPSLPEIFCAGRDRSRTDSHTQSGFDNDPRTMNHVLETVLCKKPSARGGLQDHELRNY